MTTHSDLIREILSKRILPSDPRNGLPDGERRHNAALDLAAEIVRKQGDDEDGRIAPFFWRWIERAKWDKAIDMKHAIDVLVLHPSAPWNKNRADWDTRHKEYDAEIDATIKQGDAMALAVEALEFISRIETDPDKVICMMRIIDASRIAKNALAAQGHLRTPAQAGWKPIYTAPKDGRNVRLLCESGEEDTGFYSAAEWSTEHGNGEPTHWKPAAPEATGV